MLAHHGIRLGMHGGGVERIVAIEDAQEARRLLEGLRRQGAALPAARPLLERAVAVAIGDDVSGEAVADAGYPRQQWHGSGVQIHADGVHAVLHHRVERARELGLGNVVLVLADADGFRVDLHQLGERVLQAAGDGNRAAYA